MSDPIDPALVPPDKHAIRVLTAPPSASPPRPLPSSVPVPPHGAEADSPFSVVPTFETFDRLTRAIQARYTHGVSPTSAMSAWSDWWIHMLRAPGKQMSLAANAAVGAARLGLYAAQAAAGRSPAPIIKTGPDDHRFADAAWQTFPLNVMSQAYLSTEDWWTKATTGVRGVTRRHEARVGFLAKQALGALSPDHNPLVNPTIIKRTKEEGGQNFVRGLENWLADYERMLSGEPDRSQNFEVGRNLALTPGAVVFRNHIFELIQYAPLTDDVYAEPILIVPAWIMKYYILDLSSQNSLVRYLVSKGHTVFIMSWKNPGVRERDTSLDDYRASVASALDVIGEIVPDAQVHAAGYCLGGTILSIEAATLARDGDKRLRSVTLLAAQTDFAEAGELMLFVDESQVTFLEDMMWDQGFLDTHQMSGAFQILRSNELIWSRLIRSYVLGERENESDLTAWNADQTRMPARMHGEYLRSLFLENRLSAGRFAVGGRTISLGDIAVPIFAVGTTKDHIAPWRSVYKINLTAKTEITFVLTAGGHNAGIVSEPGHRGRRYQIMGRAPNERYIDPDTWAAIAPFKEGSWWAEWDAWLVGRGSGAKVHPPELGAAERGYPPLCPAPGTFVYGR